MLTFSEQIKEKSPDSQRRLYTLFQREVKAGRIPALKLLTRFELQNTKEQPRQVQDYAYTGQTGEQVQDWIATQERPHKENGFTVEQVQHLSDDDLSALIQQQRTKPKKRKAKATKNTTKTTNPDPEIPS